MLKCYRHNEFVKIVWRESSVIFTFRPIALRQLTIIDIYWTRWSTGNEFALGARGLRFEPRLWQGFYGLFCCCWGFTFYPKLIICHEIVKLLFPY